MSLPQGRLDGNTGTVKTLSRRIAIAAAAVIVVCASWFGVQQYRSQRGRPQRNAASSQTDCEQRNAAFNRRIENLKRDAHERLRIGTKKADVSQFFKEHDIPLTLTESEAIGTLYTSGGCAPLGCGTNRALIGVRVKIDAGGAVTDEPVVLGMYVDCV